jgi:hypothetical protein
MRESNKVQIALNRAYSELQNSYSRSDDEQADIDRFSKSEIKNVINVLE